MYSTTDAIGPYRAPNDPSRMPGKDPGQTADRRSRLLAPLIGTGVFMLAYLTLRPYGDALTGPLQAQALASIWWVWSHVFGIVALSSFAWLVVRTTDTTGGLLARAARGAALAGAVLVLPYYGAEAFALHVIGVDALATGSNPASMVDAVRDQPIALTLFGVGLILMAAAGVLLALVWQHRSGATPRRWAAWPLGILVVLFVPQFYLPPAGRIAYGVAYAVAAAVLLVATIRRDVKKDLTAVTPDRVDE